MEDEKTLLYIAIEKLEAYIDAQRQYICSLEDSYNVLVFIFFAYMGFNIFLIYFDDVLNFLDKWKK